MKNFIEPLSSINYIKMLIKGLNFVHLSCLDYEALFVLNPINHLFKV